MRAYRERRTRSRVIPYIGDNLKVVRVVGGIAAANAVLQTERDQAVSKGILLAVYFYFMFERVNSFSGPNRFSEFSLNGFSQIREFQTKVECLNAVDTDPCERQR